MKMLLDQVRNAGLPTAPVILPSPYRLLHYLQSQHVLLGTLYEVFDKGDRSSLSLPHWFVLWMVMFSSSR